MPILKKDLNEVIDDLKRREYLIFSTALKNALNLQDIKEVNKYALILGNEANGISSEVIKKSDASIKIEMDEAVESLNVAVAGAICLYTLNNKRK